jgi:tetratricopeptide (TPR) repeat protein
VPDNPRIEELRRRVQKDPASIAFAQLAEEYRRAGSYEDAVLACRTGLVIHPSYLSARVTLGRALIELNSLEEAKVELLHVLQHAPENLAAIRGMAEIHHRSGELEQALPFYKSALAIARHDPDLEQTVNEISRELKPARPPAGGGISLERASAEFLDSFANPPSPPPVVPDHRPDEETEAEREAVRLFEESLFLDLPVQPEQPVHVEPPPHLEPPAQLNEPLQLDEPLQLEHPVQLEQPVHLEQSVEPEQEVQKEAVVDPRLPRLERFLQAIHTYRLRRAV